MNNGQLTPQTQTIYECKSVTVEANEFFRVNFEDYLFLKNQIQFTCKEEQQVKNVCMCPKTHDGHLCQVALQQKCWVYITDPDF